MVKFYLTGSARHYNVSGDEKGKVMLGIVFEDLTSIKTFESSVTLLSKHKQIFLFYIYGGLYLYTAS